MLSDKVLVNLYRYCVAISNEADSGRVKQVLALADPAAGISQRAITGEDDMAVRALTRFIEIYAALAGELALLALAYGGVILAGGIAPRIAGRI
jgi:glucokinase